MNTDAQNLTDWREEDSLSWNLRYSSRRVETMLAMFERFAFFCLIAGFRRKSRKQVQNKPPISATPTLLTSSFSSR